LTSDNVIDALKLAVDNRALTPEVLHLLLPGGRPFDCEGQLWDYKAQAPSLPAEPNESDKTAHRVAIAEIVKDAVAFYNAFGGYIVFGVKDTGSDRLVGVSTAFNYADLNKTLQSYAGISIECLYHTLECPVAERSVTIGLLLIPRRPAGAPPVKLVRKGPEKPNGKRTFVDEVYVRIRDECRAATNTHEDWLFLHSDRLPPEQVAGAALVKVQAHLPARDLDLLEFVGRENHLANLRKWIGDIRSPVRLVTGIGGLGKTTLAYRFAEEVVETGAGAVETVIWLTAKQQTYSALRGKMVAISRVDFEDLGSLFNAILKALAHEMPVSEEEPSFAELSDRLVEALSTIPSLVVVDDLDSLSPEEQKETVAALNSVALRTVGRELAPSRVLMTSRIDQGLPPTAIVNIRGLERPDFDLHLANLCAAFDIEPYVGRDLSEIFEASSGSPLFAASIVRLVKLGENRRDVVAKWHGSDGEEVRSFAFQRELERLTSMEARVLYAVLLLGETTLSDVAEIVDMQPRAVRDQIAGLQAYHLMATVTNRRGDSAISVPDELQTVVELVRTRLGASAKQVEEAVARAHERSGNQERQVGTSIRTIVRLWEADRFDEAVITAQELRTKFPRNGDAASILGASLLRTRPPRYREADLELDAAAKLGCAKPELLPNMIRAKTQIEDWSGLRDLTSTRISSDRDRDIALAAHLKANSEMIRTARVRDDRRRISELAIEAVERITAKLRRTHLEPGYFNALVGQRLDFARVYVDSLDRLHTHSGDRIRVFEGVARLATADVVLTNQLEKGLSALEVWWHNVEGRPVVDLAACKLLSRMLGKLESIERQLAGYKRDPGAASDIERRRRELEFRGAALQASIG
jgi:KaiC/GvpD/RAD55 family RecA-like ATPase